EPAPHRAGGAGRSSGSRGIRDRRRPARPRARRCFMQTINADRVAEEIERGSVQLINVLNADDFTREHIPGSVNIPVSHPGFVERVEQTVGDKGTRVVVYCASRECPASENTARKLEEAGFSNVMDFEEGMQGWKDAGRRVSA